MTEAPAGAAELAGGQGAERHAHQDRRARAEAGHEEVLEDPVADGLQGQVGLLQGVQALAVDVEPQARAGQREQGRHEQEADGAQPRPGATGQAQLVEGGQLRGRAARAHSGEPRRRRRRPPRRAAEGPASSGSSRRAAATRSKSRTPR